MSGVSALPDAETIRQTAQQVLSRPYYRQEVPADSSRLLQRALEWIVTQFRWLGSFLDGLPPVTWWLVVILLIVALVLLAVHIAYTLLRALGVVHGKQRLERYSPEAAAERLRPEELERQASEAAGRHEYITAVRLLFRAALVRLEWAQKRKPPAGLTNREHLRRYRATPISEPLRRLVETIDVKWYGQGLCAIDDYRCCHEAHHEIQLAIAGMTHAVRS